MMASNWSMSCTSRARGRQSELRLQVWQRVSCRTERRRPVRLSGMAAFSLIVIMAPIMEDKAGGSNHLHGGRPLPTGSGHRGGIRVEGGHETGQPPFAVRRQGQPLAPALEEPRLAERGQAPEILGKEARGIAAVLPGEGGEVEFPAAGQGLDGGGAQPLLGARAQAVG